MFYWLVPSDLLMIMPAHECNRTFLMNVDSVPCYLMASLGHNELNTFSPSEIQCNLNHIWRKFVHVSLTYNTSAMVLVMTWQQVITWTNVGWVLWCHSASLGPSELEISNHGKSLDTSAFTKLWNLPWQVTEVQFHCNGLHSSDHIGKASIFMNRKKQTLSWHLSICSYNKVTKVLSSSECHL